MKKYIWIPIALLIWLGGCAWFFRPAVNPDLSYLRYYLTIGACLVVIGFASFFIKKKEDRKREEKENNKKR